MSTTTLETTQSRRLHERACRFLPKGVTGDGRWSEPYPLAFQRGYGKWLVDVDGNKFLDYHGGFGSAILGYSHPEVDEAVQRATTEVGTFVGLPHPLESQLAERLCALIPLAEKVAFCGGGGSDPIYHAVRLARAATGRSKIIKIEGGYHGWHADVGVSTKPTVANGEAVGLPEPVPNSLGSLPSVTSEVIVATANDPDALREAFDRWSHEIAAVLVEPVLYSCGCIPVDKEYLETARKLCTARGSVLIFDEVMSGFRNGLGGAGASLGVVADLGAFGKAVANGYVMAVLAGKSELMNLLTPAGQVFYSGTYNGHPLSLAAAMATLDVIERDDVVDRICGLGDRLQAHINRVAQEDKLTAVCQSVGSIWNLYFNAVEIRNCRDLVRSSDETTDRLNDEYRDLLRDNGIYLHPRFFNRAFISAAHDEDDIDRTAEVIGSFLVDHHDDLV